MGFESGDWFACPSCDEREEVSSLAYKTDIVFECYECGLTSEYAIGEDIPLQNLDVDKILDIADEGASD